MQHWKAWCKPQSVYRSIDSLRPTNGSPKPSDTNKTEPDPKSAKDNNVPQTNGVTDGEKSKEGSPTDGAGEKEQKPTDEDAKKVRDVESFKARADRTNIWGT